MTVGCNPRSRDLVCTCGATAWPTWPSPSAHPAPTPHPHPSRVRAMSPGGPSRSPQAGDDQSPWQPFVASSPPCPSYEASSHPWPTPCPSCEASSHPWLTFQPWSTVGPSQAPFFWSPGGHFQPRSQPAGADRSPGSPFEMRPDDRSPGGGVLAAAALSG